MDKIYIYMLEENNPHEGENVFGVLYSSTHYSKDKIMGLIKSVDEKTDQYGFEYDNQQKLKELEKHNLYSVCPIILDSYMTRIYFPNTFKSDKYIDLDKLKEVKDEI